MQFEELIHPITVSELNQYLKDQLNRDERLKTICIEGEISNFTQHTSGHIYFTLKDHNAAVRAVMFRGYRASLKFIPNNGMQVLVIGDVALYERSGTVQLYVQRMLPTGIGSVHTQFELLKEKLDKEGLFSAIHKKSIPKYPNKICLITSPTGAALQDMKNVLSRRYPLAEIIMFPTSVQGEGAAAEIVQAISKADNIEADLILLARGGGSLEDLYVFNDESVARAIYAAQTPVITGIGHETDFTIADFVADLRAPTPSAAAELAVPDQQDLFVHLMQIENRLHTQISLSLQRAQSRIDGTEEFMLQQLKNRISQTQSSLQYAEEFLHQKIQNHFQLSSHALQLRAAALAADNPLALYAKGYAKVQTDMKRPIMSTDDVNLGDTLTVDLPDGTLTSTVTNKEKRA